MTDRRKMKKIAKKNLRSSLYGTKGSFSGWREYWTREIRSIQKSGKSAAFLRQVFNLVQ